LKKLTLKSIMADKKPQARGTERKVVVNIYDINKTGGKEIITKVNQYSKEVGIGVFHSGVAVEGIAEWGFGFCEEGTGVFQARIRNCLPEKYKFRESIELGTTRQSELAIKTLVHRMAVSPRWQGNSYDLTRNNCNHFSNALSMELVGKGIPKWINRGADGLDSVRMGMEFTAKKIHDVANSDTVKSVKHGVQKAISHPNTKAAVNSLQTAASKGISMINSLYAQCLDPNTRNASSPLNEVKMPEPNRRPNPPADPPRAQTMDVDSTPPNQRQQQKSILESQEETSSSRSTASSSHRGSKRDSQEDTRSTERQTLLEN